MVLAGASKGMEWVTTDIPSQRCSCNMGVSGMTPGTLFGIEVAAALVGGARRGGETCGAPSGGHRAVNVAGDDLHNLGMADDEPRSPSAPFRRIWSNIHIPVRNGG